MRKLFKTLLIGLFCISINTSFFAQTLDLESTYKISGKAKRGVLGKVTYDSGNKIYSLVYVTKSTDRKAKFETYKFDKDFNFIEKTEDVIEYEKAKLKFSWFNWNGDEYSTTGMYVEPNLIGTLVLRQKRITYKYDWFLLGYYTVTDILKKVKPKTEDGRKLFYYTHAEDDITGDVYILCGIKPLMKKNGGDWFQHMQKFVILKYNKDVELVNETSFEIKYPQKLAFARRIDNEKGGVGGLVLVFAPTKEGGKKVADPDMKNYRYIRTDNNPSVVENIEFKSHNSFWKINELIYNPATDDVYIFGPSADNKAKYYNEMTTTSKFASIQLMKVADRKIEYLTQTNLDEFEAKLKKPASQKKTPAYKGKKFRIANYHISNEGDFFVSGQNFKPSDNGNKYLDVLGFHFDKTGKLKAQYSVDINESNPAAKAHGTEQIFLENIQTGNVFWILFEIKGVAPAHGKMLTYPRIGKINVKNGTINDFLALGNATKHYLDTNFPFLQTTEENSLVFFGSDKGGKEIWFARIKLE